MTETGLRSWAARYAVGVLVLALLVAGCTSEGTAAIPSDPGSSASSRATGSVSGPEKNPDGYADLSVEELADALREKDFTLVNVHIPYEGELPQTDLSIPYNEIEQQASELPDKNAPIVLYCRSGAMSTSAAKDLVKLGYTNVMELDGGMVAWESAGQELLSKE